MSKSRRKIIFPLTIHLRTCLTKTNLTLLLIPTPGEKFLQGSLRTKSQRQIHKLNCQIRKIRTHKHCLAITKSKIMKRRRSRMSSKNTMKGRRVRKKTKSKQTRTKSKSRKKKESSQKMTSDNII